MTFLQMHVTLCEYLIFHEFRRNLYITLAKYLEQEVLQIDFFQVLYTSSLYFSKFEAVSWDESSRLLYDSSDMLFIVPCLIDLSDTSF